ncbi:MAG: hypothetical protein ACK4NP_07145 [Parvularculaceae bacterium]
MACRVGLSSLVLGLSYGRFDVGLAPASQPEAIGLAALTIVVAVIAANEYRHFYQRSDELIRRTLVASLAIASLATLVAAGLQGVADLLFGLPEIPMVGVFLFAAAVSSIAWMVAAWKSS